MNIFAVGPLIVSLLTLCFGVFVYIKNKKVNLNRLFCLLCISVFVWAFGYSQMYNTKTNSSLALFWARFGYCGVVFIPVFVWHFIVTFLDLKRQKFTIFFVYFIGVIFLFISRTRFFLYDMYTTYFWGNYPKAGPLYIYFVLFFAWIFLRVVFLLYRDLRLKKRKLLSMQINRIKYLLFGFAIATTSLVDYVPNYGFEIYPWAYLSAFGWLICMWWASFRYYLMDIKLARQYLAMNIFYGVVSSVVFVVLAFFLRQWFWTTAVVIFLAILLSPYLHRRMTGVLEPTFLRETYQRRKEFDRLKESDLGYISEQIAWNLVGGISEIMQVDKLSFFMYVDNRKEFRPQAQIDLDDEIGTEPIPYVTLRPDNPMVRHLAKVKKTMIKEELAGSDPLRQEMQHLYAEISIPLFVGGELIGILNLGPKENQEMYHQEEIKKLTELCHQAENHLSHTRFMEKRATFSRELAHDMKNLVAKAIEPTLETILEIKDPQRREQELKSLIRQLGYLRYCLEGNFDEVSLIERLAYHQYTFESAQIAKIIAACASLYKNSLAKAGLTLEQILPKNLPLVLVNREDIPKVFNNLFDNALRFTPSGGKITIKAEQKGDEVLITFSDTGRGIAKEDLKTIFETKLKMPEEGEIGTGLGLVIVRDIIEAHKGRLWLESEPDKGTTFYFTLRIAKENKEEDR